MRSNPILRFRQFCIFRANMFLAHCAKTEFVGVISATFDTLTRQNGQYCPHLKLSYRFARDSEQDFLELRVASVTCEQKLSKRGQVRGYLATAEHYIYYILYISLTVYIDCIVNVYTHTRTSLDHMSHQSLEGSWRLA